MAAIALATLSTTGCQELIALAEKNHSLQNGTYAMGGTTALTAATAASPSSIAGKKIVLDYSTAQNSEGDTSNHPNISWGLRKKCDSSKTTTPTFGKNNRYERRGFADDFVIWTYKKQVAALLKSQPRNTNTARPSARPSIHPPQAPPPVVPKMNATATTASAISASPSNKKKTTIPLL